MKNNVSFIYQCITFRQRTALVHSFLCTFLHYFTIALFSCCTSSRVTSCCTRFMLQLFHFALFSSFSFQVLYTFHVALPPCYTSFMLSTVFKLHLFTCCTPFIFHLFSCCPMLHSAHEALFFGIQNSNFINKRLHHRCFPVKFVKYLRTPANDCFKKFSLKLSQC